MQEKVRVRQPMPNGKKELKNEIYYNQNESNQGKQTLSVGQEF
jgi:hypothetical protein